MQCTSSCCCKSHYRNKKKRNKTEKNEFFITVALEFTCGKLVRDHTLVTAAATPKTTVTPYKPMWTVRGTWLSKPSPGLQWQGKSVHFKQAGKLEKKLKQETKPLQPMWDSPPMKNGNISRFSKCPKITCLRSVKNPPSGWRNYVVRKGGSKKLEQQSWTLTKHCNLTHKIAVRFLFLTIVIVDFFKHDHNRSLIWTMWLFFQPWQQMSPNLNEVVILTQTTMFT